MRHTILTADGDDNGHAMVRLADGREGLLVAKTGTFSEQLRLLDMPDELTLTAQVSTARQPKAKGQQRPLF